MVPRWRDTLRLIVVLLPAWAGIGTSTWMVARALDPSAPFGGYRESGFGREGGRHGLLGYLKGGQG